MNIAMMQTLAPKQVEFTPKQTNVKKEASNKQFDEYLSVAKQSNTNPSAQTEATTDTTNEAKALLEATDMQEIFETLGIELDESGNFAIVNNEAVALDEMMNLEDITAALGMTVEQLQDVLQQITETPINDVWDLIDEASVIMPQLISAIQGELDMSPKDAKKVLEAIKLIQVVATKTDTVYSQEIKLTDLKMTVQTTLVQLTTTQSQQQGQTSSQQSKTEVEITQGPVVQNVAPSEPKTVTVTLPTSGKAQQSEALIKEIQQYINRSQLSGSNGQLKLMLKLYPENLGQVRIEIVQRDGVLTARLLASTPLGKELLDSNLNQLKNSFTAQNIQMERVEIAQALQNSERSSDQQLFNHFFKQQQQAEQEEDDDEKDDKEVKSFSEFLSEEVEV